MAIKHSGRTLTAREQKAKVMEWTGWTSEQYQREYDILRNKVRAFERVRGEKLSTPVADILARDARARWWAEWSGEKYTPSAQYAAVAAAPSISTGRAPSKAATARITAAGIAAVERQYAGLISRSMFSERLQAEIERAKAGNISLAELDATARHLGEMSNLNARSVRGWNKAAPPWEQLPVES